VAPNHDQFADTASAIRSEHDCAFDLTDLAWDWAFDGADDDLVQCFYKLFEREDLEEVFEEFLVPVQRVD